jgi:hypothetical protein
MFVVNPRKTFHVAASVRTYLVDIIDCKIKLGQYCRYVSTDDPRSCVGNNLNSTQVCICE